MTVAVVILNWNGKKLLQTFLPSVVAHSEGAALYLADNNSTDGSVAFVQKTYPQITILQNRDNAGYAKGYNDALKHVPEDVYVLLNSDVEVAPNWLGPVIDTMAQNPSILAAQPKLLDYHNKDYFEYAGAAGGFLDRLGYPFCRGRIFNTLEKDLGQYETATPVFWASGACLFVRRNAFWNVRGFDEELFAHQEEIDLCWRLRATGGSVWYVPNSKVYHVGGATLAKAHPRKTFYNFRNSLLILVKNVPNRSVWLLIAVRMVLDGVAALQFLLSGKPDHFVAVFKAHLGFYGMLGSFRKKRNINSKNVDYKHVTSIVWAYYIQRKRYFNDLS